MLLAFLCGAVIGSERSYKNRPAGFRTHILVCIGAATASMTGIYLYLCQGLPTDISRLGAAVVSGLGFIGAGTIIVTRNRTVKGLTTAAGPVGQRRHRPGHRRGLLRGRRVRRGAGADHRDLFSAAGQRILHTPEFSIRLHYDHKPALDQVMRYCKDSKVSITNLKVVTERRRPPAYTAVLSLRPASGSTATCC